MLTGSGTQVLATLVATLVLARLLFPDDFGRFAVVQAHAFLVSALLNLRLRFLVLRSTEQELAGGGLERIQAANILLALVLGAAVAAELWAFGLLTHEAAILAAGVAIGPVINVQRAVLERGFAYRRLGLLETATQVGSHAATVFGAAVGLGPIVLYARQPIQAAIELASLRFLGAGRLPPVRWLGAAEWKAIVGEARGIWVDGWFEEAFERIPTLLVSALAGAAPTGLFFQAKRLATLPNQLSTAVSSRIMVNYASRSTDPTAKRTFLLRSLGLEFAVLAVAAGAVLAWPAIIVGAVLGPRWVGAAPILQALAGLLLLQTLFTTLRGFFIAQRRMRPFTLLGRVAQFTSFAAVTAVALQALPVPVAVALGVSASYAAACVVLLVAGVGPAVYPRHGPDASATLPPSR